MNDRLVSTEYHLCTCLFINALFSQFQSSVILQLQTAELLKSEHDGYFVRWSESRCARRRHVDDAVNQTSEQQKQKQTRRLPCWLHANEAVPAERRSSRPSVGKQTSMWSRGAAAVSPTDTQNMHYSMQEEFWARIGRHGWTGTSRAMRQDHTEPSRSHFTSLKFPLVNI